MIRWLGHRIRACASPGRSRSEPPTPVRTAATSPTPERGTEAFISFVNYIAVNPSAPIAVNPSSTLRLG